MAGGGGYGGLIRQAYDQMGSQFGGGGTFDPFQSGALPGYQGALQRSYATPAQNMQMGSQYGQLGPYNTIARDMASGNLGNFMFGQGGGLQYQAGMNPQGRAGAWGAPMASLAQSGYFPGAGQWAGRGGGGRNVGMMPGPSMGMNGLRYPGVGAGPSSQFPAGAYGFGPSGQDYRGGFRPPWEANQFWNPNSRTPGVNPTATPRGLVDNRHPFSSYVRLPGQTGGMETQPVRPAETGWQQQVAAQGQPVYQSDAWRRQATGVALPFQLPASAGQMGFNRSRFLY